SRFAEREPGQNQRRGSGYLEICKFCCPCSGEEVHLFGDIYLVDGTFQDLTVAMQGGDRSALHLGRQPCLFPRNALFSKGCRLAGLALLCVGEPVANTAHLERCTRILLLYQPGTVVPAVWRARQRPAALLPAS